MSSTTEHYQQHLARIYSWMAGGAEATISRGQQELAGLGLLHGDIEHEQGSWLLRVSAYRKLRLEPARVKRQLETHGFVVDAGTGLSGMIRMTATLA